MFSCPWWTSFGTVFDDSPAISPAADPARSNCGVFDLPVSRVSSWIFNTYLLTSSATDTVVIDAGLPVTARMAGDELDRLDRESTNVLCVATHGHCDHVGGMPYLRSAVSSSTYLPVLCEAFLEGKTPTKFGSDAALRFLPVFAGQKFSFTAACEFASASKEIGFGGGNDEFQFPFRPDGFLGHGDKLPGADDWQVIETPGHSDEAICFYHPDSRTLLSGDAVVTLDGKAWFNPEWVNAQACRDTEELLRGLEVDYLLPGHGVPIEGNIWKDALSFCDKPEGSGVLARCARRFGRWDSVT